MKIGKKTLQIYVGMFIICLFSFTTGLHEVVFGGLNNAILVLLLGVLLVWDRKISFFNDYLSLGSILLVAIMLSNNQDNKNLGTFFVYGSLAFILAWVFFILTKKDSKWHKPFFKFCLCFGIFHSLCTWMFRLIPSFYTSKIIPIFGQWSDSMLKQFKNGWAPGLAPSYSANAVYLAFGFCCAVGVLIIEKKRKNYIPVLICISALLLTGKRSQLLAAVFSFILMYYFYNSDAKNTRLFKICGIMITAFVVFDVASQFVPELANFINRFYQTAKMGDVSLGRTTRFAEAWIVFLRNPIFGIGWNGSSYFFAQNNYSFINVHNIYIQLLCETGLVGSMIYFSFFIYNLLLSIRIVKRIKSEKLSQIEKAIICSAFMIEVFFLLYGITGNSLYDFQTLFPYLASCEIIIYYSKKFGVIFRKEKYR